MIKLKNKWLLMPLMLLGFQVSASVADVSLPTTSDQSISIPSMSSSRAVGLSEEDYVVESRQSLLLPGEVDVRKLLPVPGDSQVPPYGANIFAGGYETERADGLNSNYLIAPGDKINIWLWGAVNYTDVVTVDNQGNIFVPEIGPINVLNVPANRVNTLVTRKIKQVYTQNVSVYVNLLTATPVSVYLTGSVIRPGQYAGMASDSILYFLKRAGGIDSERGSYREIQILRNQKIIQSVDLYDFLQNGHLPPSSFKDGDVILVTPLKSVVTVSGKARNPFRFEINSYSSLGSEISSLAKPLPEVSHVGVEGDRKEGPLSRYMSYHEFASFEVRDGDNVIFNDDLYAQVIDVQVTGSYLGPSYFAVNKGTRLHDLLNYIPIDPELADYQSIYLLRESVKVDQKEMLDESLNRLERSVFTAPASSDGEAAIRAREAEMVLRFTERARRIEPLGKVIVSDNGQIANVLLEQGDTVFIPSKTDLILVGGEVLMPQAVVYNSEATIDDYVAWAGGFTERAEDKRIAVVRANGLVEFDSTRPIERGDQILVLPKVDTKTMQAVKDITQIIYQIAVAANVATN
uniref:polysaccharide biosynthesis/export family protein n=1 Tax=Thaumasiovibrio occultus TaxID=1891184 RepID=UPI00192D020F|nr:polysaccharide biosynthesis/export family protein [Thaumasiovibrio occultus]